MTIELSTGKYLKVYTGGIECKQVSSLDLTDPRMVAEYRERGVGDAIANSRVKSSYDQIFKELSASLKLHLNQMEKTPVISGSDTFIKFSPPQIKFHAQDAEIKSTNIVSTDPSLSFTFLMIRMVEGTNTKALGDYTISINEGKEKQMFKQLDVVSTFEYTKDGVPLNIIANNKANLDVKVAFNAEVEEVRKIIKNVLTVNFEECNVIKNLADINFQASTCSTHISQAAPEFFLDLLTCNEIFNMIAVTDYCPDRAEMVKDLESDWLD